MARARAGLAAGRSVIVDAVYATPDERTAIESVAEELGVPFCGVWLEAPEEVIMSRLAERRDDASDATPEVVRRQLEADLGDVSWHRLDAFASREAVVAAAERLLSG